MDNEANCKKLVANGNYLVAKRHRDLVFTSGMTPRSQGVMAHSGTITAERPIGEFKDAVELAASNALAAARSLLACDEEISGILALTVFIATTGDFSGHSRHFASDYLTAELGPGSAGTRAAISVISLPGGAVVEIQMTAMVEAGRPSGEREFMGAGDRMSSQPS
ncbi:Rid family hydrolase [Mesorhizobium sp. M0028]